MFVAMKTTLATENCTYRSGHNYLVDDVAGNEMIRAGVAKKTKTPPQYIADLLDRLDDGKGKACLFMPFVGEFGHEIMSHIRLVHFHKARRKIVCCRPGHEVLYPSAAEFVTDWTDPIPDEKRVGTMREHAIEWPDITARFPDHHPVAAGRLTYEQELWAINPEIRLPFKPRRRGLKVDLVFGVRWREFTPERNWPHWQMLANAARDAGLGFAVIGNKETSFDLDGQEIHTGDYDTDAAVELLQNCRLYVGTDSGGSHLAATVGAPMLLFRETASASRDLTKRMEQVNAGKVEVVAGGWTKPQRVIQRMMESVHEKDVITA